jgi:hypothetical protein
MKSSPARDAGARRLAGLTHVPVLVRGVPDNAALAMALMNISAKT